MSVTFLKKLRLDLQGEKNLFQTQWINEKTLGSVKKERAAASLGHSLCSKAGWLLWLPRTLYSMSSAKLYSTETALGTSAPGQEWPSWSGSLSLGKCNVLAFCSWP